MLCCVLEGRLLHEYLPSRGHGYYGLGSLHISRGKSDVCVLGFSCFRSNVGWVGVCGTICNHFFMVVSATIAEPNIFLRICTHTHIIPISIDLCPPKSTHSKSCVHPCPPILFKLRPCIQKLCNVYNPPTPSFGWIGQIKGRSLSWLQPGALLG